MNKDNMIKLLFDNMKKGAFSNITKWSYKEDKFNLDDMDEFFIFIEKIKPLFGFHKINKNNKALMDYFWCEIRKLEWKDLKLIIIYNPFIVNFFDKMQLNKYIEEEIKNNNNWWIFNSTFNPKNYKDLNIDISKLTPSLPQAGRYMLNNKHVSAPVISKLLKRIVIQDFWGMNGLYFSWDEMFLLIKKSGLDLKLYLLKLAGKFDIFGCIEIIDGIFKSNNQSLKNDKKFANKIYDIKKHLWKNSSAIKKHEMKFEISKEELLKQYENIDFIYDLFILPKEYKSESILTQLSMPKTHILNYDTTQVNQQYQQTFSVGIDFTSRFYEGYLKWIQEKGGILLFDEVTPELKIFNILFKKWIEEGDIHISGYISLLLLKKIILIIFPKHKEKFEDMSFYETTKFAANNCGINNIKWTTELLFAPSGVFYQVRNKIAHFDDSINKSASFAIVCLAMEYIRLHMKTQK